MRSPFLAIDRDSLPEAAKVKYLSILKPGGIISVMPEACRPIWDAIKSSHLSEW